LMHAFRQNPLGLSGCTAFFVSFCEARLGAIWVLSALHTSDSWPFWQQLDPIFQTCCHCQILPRHSLRSIAHGTLPIHGAKPGARLRPTIE
jgi:hypothetical protein